MICRNEVTKIDYEYTFIEEGKVRLRNQEQDFCILYEDWCNNYYIVDKWKKIL